MTFLQSAWPGLLWLFPNRKMNIAVVLLKQLFVLQTRVHVFFSFCNPLEENFDRTCATGTCQHKLGGLTVALRRVFSSCQSHSLKVKNNEATSRLDSPQVQSQHQKFCPDPEWGQTCQQKSDVQERPLEQTKRDPKRLNQPNSTKIRENPATIHPNLEKRSKIHEKQVADRKSAKIRRTTGGSTEKSVFFRKTTLQRRSSDVPATFQRRFSNVPATFMGPKQAIFKKKIRFPVFPPVFWWNLADFLSATCFS